MLLSIINTSSINDYTDDLIASSINNLITAFREAKHIIVSDKAFFTKILEYPDLFDSRTRNAVVKASQAQREYRALISMVSTYIEIDFSMINQPVRRISNAGSDVLCFSYDYFSDSSKIQIPKLLCEDLSDTHLYRLIADYFKSTNNLSSLDIKLLAQNGGGGNTETVFREIVSNGDFCICLLDSDQKHPAGPSGGTCNRFNVTEYPINGKYQIIEVHEAENLIPNAVIEEVIINGNYQRSLIDNMDNLKSACEHNIDVKKYFDYKEGLSINKAFTLDRLYGNFWGPVIDNTPRLPRNRCIRNHQCECENECHPIAGFGSNILVHTLEYLATNHKSSLRQALKPPIDTLWQSIGKEVFSWGCSPKVKARS